MTVSTGKDLEAFLSLVKAGLWEKDAQLSFNGIDFSIVYQIAQQQAVVGLVAAGIEHISGFTIAKENLLPFVSDAFQLEQKNTSMNSFIAVLIDRLRRAGIYVLLVKGQGVAQCYERPLWRACGDVDLFLSNNNFEPAKSFLAPLSAKTEEEAYRQHISMSIDAWEVELHGTLRSGLWRCLDKSIEEVEYAILCEGRVRSWMNGNTQTFLPNVDEDIIIVFSHILQHFYQEGIGLRQICDWCRLLWTYKDTINRSMLESRIRKAGIMSEWKAFSALGVDYLGMPVEAMPFYSVDSKWSQKASKILGFVLETGNFGHNRDYSYQKKYPYIVYKSISFWEHLKDGAFFFSIFPLDSIKVTWRRIIVGFSVVLQGKRHE